MLRTNEREDAPFEESVVNRFRAKFQVGEPDECWEWQASRDNHGYGRMSAPRQWLSPLRATRISWALANGRLLAPEEHVLHACDNPPCVNPAHLSIGDPAENSRQKVERGRLRGGALYGEANHRAKLTEAEVKGIRSAAASGETYAAIARSYGVDPSLVRRIVLRTQWTQVA